MAAAQGPVATYPSKRRQCSGWTEPRAAGTSPGAQHTPELCWGSWPRCRAPRHARTAVAWRKSLGDGQNSSGPVLCSFVPYAEVTVILLGSVHVLGTRGVTKEQWGTLMGLQRLQSSIPRSSSWFPNSPQTLGRSGKETGLSSATRDTAKESKETGLSSATRNDFGTCRCKTGSYFPLGRRSKSLCSTVLPYIQGIFTASLLQLPRNTRGARMQNFSFGCESRGSAASTPSPVPHRTWTPPAQSFPTHPSVHLFQRVY